MKEWVLISLVLCSFFMQCGQTAFAVYVCIRSLNRAGTLEEPSRVGRTKEKKCRPLRLVENWRAVKAAREIERSEDDS